jgi:ATP-dependent DNA ligase
MQGRGATSIFGEKFFTRQVSLSQSRFMRPMHPKAEIKPERLAIQRVLDLGWVGQLKIHGHRAQIHIPADPEVDPIAYNRQGQQHRKALTPALIRELRRWFAPEKAWTVIDGEWLKDKDKIFVFDLLKKDGQSLEKMTFLERFELLPKDFISPRVQVLPLVRNLERCLDILAQKDPDTEGLVFKSTTSAGFSDTSIVRCRRVGAKGN